jgi:hypothetical protein
MKIELSKEQIAAILKALYTEKFEIIQRKQCKQLHSSIEQNSDVEYIGNQNLRVLFEFALREERC